MKRRLSTFLVACALVVPTITAPPMATAQDATAFSVPSAPTDVQARRGAGGITVTWRSVSASPAVTAYVVDGGPGTCPVVVGPSKQSVVMPTLPGAGRVIPRVEAVNAYGVSAAGAAAPVRATGLGDARYRVAQFLQFSDFHGALPPGRGRAGAAVLASAFARDRAAVAPTFTVSSGDSIGGSPPISAVFEEVPTIQALNLMGLDVSTFGNHEHDRPLPHLRRMIDLSRFPWVVSNYSSLAPLQGSRNGTKPYVLLRRDGITVGVVGMNTEDTPEVVKAGNLSYGRGLQQEVAISASVRGVQARVDEARRAGAQIVVALLHQGWQENSNGKALGRLPEIAAQLRGVDVVYGGHTHQQYQSMANRSPVIEVPNSGQGYSRTRVCLDTRTGRVLGSAAEYVPAAALAGLTPDPRTQTLVQRYERELAARLDGLVGRVDAVLPRGGTPPVERSGETPLGDLTADTVRAKYGTQLALIAGGSIRDTLPSSGYTPLDPTLRRPSPGSTGPYDVALGDVMAVFPFGDEVATTSLSGDQLWQALENGVSGWPSDGRFPQVSGLRYAFDPTRPSGSRVTAVTLADGTPIRRDATQYTIATVAYLVNGGDGYAGVFNPDLATVREPLLDALLERLREDLAAGRVTLSPPADGRITVQGGAS